ncbi:Early nodulin-like protein [Rhynchospora pubera]|uniref:Early nodulin-like protein n=1 Tax=Rhynchospora pubera TaxID=906938 RepID=A0AAV8BSZ2_9POAL|nr:Early nodulin-like protein [Rhynchospora pubera]KAJ4801286.1 Early nodulin-like protein [Rhynchospora pubera]
MHAFGNHPISTSALTILFPVFPQNLTSLTVKRSTMAAKALVLLLFLGLTSFCTAAVLKVGDDKGWTIVGNVNYSSWASAKKFKIGDVILFEYNKNFHNVMLVSKKDYKSCNATNPIATYNSGNDSITITRSGHNFYICGVPGHCAIGQKVDIRVEKTKGASSPRSAPVPESSTSSPSPGTDTGDAAGTSSSTTAALAPKPSSGSRFVPAYLGFGVAVMAAIATLVV